MFNWVRRRVDPDELMAIVLIGVCAWRAVAAWNDLVGKPRDAPHLHLDPHFRAILWMVCALISLIGLRIPRGSKLRFWAHSPMGAGLMFSFVLASYTASWVVSWPAVDWVFDDELIKGDPNAWGSMPYYFLGMMWALAITVAPWDWNYLRRSRSTWRPGRLEKKRG